MTSDAYDPREIAKFFPGQSYEAIEDLCEVLAQRSAAFDVETSTGPFAPILPVPVDEVPSAVDSGARDWGDVYDDVVGLIAAYDGLIEAVSNGSGTLRTVGDLTAEVARLEAKLRIEWRRTVGPPGTCPYATDQPRRWRYRVC